MLGKKVCFEYINTTFDDSQRLHVLDLYAVSSLDYCPASKEMRVEYYGNHICDKFGGITKETWEKILDAYLSEESICALPGSDYCV